MTFGGLPTSSETRPRGLGFGARLDDLWLRLATSREIPYRLYTRDSLAGREADQSNSFENVLDIGFDYSRSDFSGGEGLDWFPKTNSIDQSPLDILRFFDSKNIDLNRAARGERANITLSNKAETWFTAAAGIAGIEYIAASNTHLYTTDGETIKRFDSWDDAGTPDSTWTSPAGQLTYNIKVDAADNAIMSLDDGSLYFKPQGDNTWNLIANTASALDDIYRYWYVKDRILAVKHDFGTPNAKYIIGEVNFDSAYANSTFTVLDTLTADVKEIIDADTAILSIAADGKIRSYVPQTDTAGGVPVLTVRGIDSMPGNEQPYAIAANQGKLLILSSERASDGTTRTIRAYNAEVLDERFDFIVGQKQLIREWYETDDEAEESLYGWKNIATDRDSFWFSIREGTEPTSIWRQDIVTLGLSRHAVDDTEAGVGSRVYNMVTWQDHVAWSNYAGKLVRLGDDYADSGYLITPNINFGLNTPINWMSTTLDAYGLTNIDGSQVELWVSTDPEAIGNWQHGTWKLVTRLSNVTDGGSENPLLETAGSSLALQLRLYPNTSGAGTPEVTRVSVRGLPTHRDYIVELPVSISDQIDVPGRVTKRIPGYGNELHTALIGMVGQHKELQVTQPPIRMRGIVDAIAEPVQYISDRGSVGRVVLVQFRGNYIPEGTGNQVTGNETLGIGLVGVAIVGVGQSGVV